MMEATIGSWFGINMDEVVRLGFIVMVVLLIIVGAIAEDR